MIIPRLKRKYFLPLLFLISTSCPVPAHASFLRIVPTQTLVSDEAKHLVRLHWSLKNEGDEAAKQVSVDFPTLDESHLIAEDLGSQRSAEISIEVPFEKLGFQTPGKYSLIYRVLYKDANLHPFSAPYVLEFSRGTAPSQVLSIRMSEGAGTENIRLKGARDISAKIENISQHPAKIETVTFGFPVEIPVRANDLKTPFDLAPGESRKIGITLTSNELALLGSSYTFNLVLSGRIDQVHFSEVGTFRAEIVESSWFNGRDFMILIFGILTCGALLHWLIRRFPRATETS